MAIDTATKRRAAAGVPFLPIGPSVTPDATRGVVWRASAAWSYSHESDVVVAYGPVAFVAGSVYHGGVQKHDLYHGGLQEGDVHHGGFQSSQAGVET